MYISEARVGIIRCYVRVIWGFPNVCTVETSSAQRCVLVNSAQKKNQPNIMRAAIRKPWTTTLLMLFLLLLLLMLLSCLKQWGYVDLNSEWIEYAGMNVLVQLSELCYKRQRSQHAFTKLRLYSDVYRYTSSTLYQLKKCQYLKYVRRNIQKA